MNRLIRYLKGYVHIRLVSRDPERFLNLCAHNQILLWGLISRNGFYEMYLSTADFFRLHTLCRKSSSKIRILGKYGLPFFLHRNRKRKAFSQASCSVSVCCLCCRFSCGIYMFPETMPTVPDPSSHFWKGRESHTEF